MEESKENLNEINWGKDGNFFGWKWSIVSLIAIIIGVIAILIVKPEQQLKNDVKNEGDFQIEMIDSIQ